MRRQGSHGRGESRREREARALLEDFEMDPAWMAWIALRPGERLVRAWKLRERLVDSRSAHDARSLPEL